MADVIFLNVGGVYFTTQRQTLAESPYDFFRMIADDPGPEVFVDRDPMYFRHILNWLRGSRYLPNDEQVLQELLCEASYYAMPDMQECIHNSNHRFDVQRSLSMLADQVQGIAIHVTQGAA